MRRLISSLGVQANQKPPARLELQGVPPMAVEALRYVFVCLEKTNYSTLERILPYILSYVQLIKFLNLLFPFTRY